MAEQARGEGPPEVAYQGEPGAYSEEALHAAFAAVVRPVPRERFADVAGAVTRREVPLGLLPVENSLAGSVTDSYDLLARGGLTVLAELIHPIRHVLMGIAGTRLEDVRRILSHPVALAQCTGFLQETPGREAVVVGDTAGAARQVAEDGDPGVAAIAGAATAERYGLKILARDLQDRPDNRTRFYLVARRGADTALPVDLPPATRTAVTLELAHQPGALMGVLEPFARRGVNLTRLESRPAGVPWRYRFFLEFARGSDPEAAERAVEEAARHTSRLEVLGTFPTLGAADAGPAASTGPGPRGSGAGW